MYKCDKEQYIVEYQPSQVGGTREVEKITLVSDGKATVIKK